MPDGFGITHLCELDGVDLQVAARELRRQPAQDGVIGVPGHDLAGLQGEEGRRRRALDAEVLCELAGNETLAVCPLRG